MRKLSIYLLLSAFVHLIGFAQSTTITPGGTTESINTNGANNGMVFSGLTTQERDAIVNPKVGQLIYNKTKGCFEFYNGFRWHNLCENDLNNSINNALVAYYPFNGNANDESGNGNNGQVNGANLSTDRFGNANKSYRFTTNQDITIPNSASKNTFPITISLWYLVESPSGLGGGGSNIFSKYSPAAWNGFSILSSQNYDNIVGESIVPWYIKDTDNRVIGSYGEPPFLQSNVEFNKWYHFVFTVNQTEGRIYVNGNLIDTHPWTGTAGSSTNNFLWKIGGLYNSWFHGKIDDVGIWNRVLTPEEITYLYQNQFNPSMTNNSQAPSAGFTYSKNGLQVLFTNTSQRASSYLWNFGNGHTDTTSSNPSITYANPGTYTVTLKATNSNGSSTSSQTITLSPSLSPEIGSDYQGGVVAYILKQGDSGYDPNQIHGIIAAKLDQTINSYSTYYSGTGVMWQQGTYIPSQQGTVFDVTGATGTAVGMGRSNTNLIIAKQTSTGRPFAAAAIAVAYTGGGYNDWFLPSKDELHKLYLNRSIIGGFFDGWYWSSSEQNEWYVEALDFSNGVSSGGYKGPGGTPYKVRAIRTF